MSFSLMKTKRCRSINSHLELADKSSFPLSFCSTGRHRRGRCNSFGRLKPKDICTYNRYKKNKKLNNMKNKIRATVRTQQYKHAAEPGKTPADCTDRLQYMGPTSVHCDILIKQLVHQSAFTFSTHNTHSRMAADCTLPP